MVSSAARVGVVVIGRNEGPRLVDCLTSLSHYTADLVYVDSGSTDGSRELARKSGVKLIELDISIPFTAARARHTGYLALISAVPDVEFVQFVDGDCEVQPGWIETGCAFLKYNESVAAVCGRRRERFADASIYNRFCDQEWDTPVGEAQACGGDSLIRCSAYDEAGGFDGRLICGEEPELCVRLRQLGWTIWRLDAEMTLHDAAMSRFSQWWRRSVRTGFGFAEVSRLHQGSRFGIWRKETKRAVLWAGILPIAICAGALIEPMVLLALVIYPLQAARIALRDRSSGPGKWSRAVYLVLGKFPELQGVLTYYWRRMLGQTSTLIEYKA